MNIADRLALISMFRNVGRTVAQVSFARAGKKEEAKRLLDEIRSHEERLEKWAWSGRWTTGAGDEIG